MKLENRPTEVRSFHGGECENKINLRLAGGVCNWIYGIYISQHKERIDATIKLDSRKVHQNDHFLYQWFIRNLTENNIKNMIAG